MERQISKHDLIVWKKRRKNDFIRFVFYKLGNTINFDVRYIVLLFYLTYDICIYLFLNTLEVGTLLPTHILTCNSDALWRSFRYLQQFLINKRQYGKVVIVLIPIFWILLVSTSKIMTCSTSFLSCYEVDFENDGTYSAVYEH